MLTDLMTKNYNNDYAMDTWCAPNFGGYHAPAFVGRLAAFKRT